MSSVLETLEKVVRPLLLSKEGRKVRIDEWSFKVHYRGTSLLLFLFSGLVCMKEYLGDHIKCVHMQEDDGDDPIIPRKVLETYCFITTTFTVPYDPKTSLWRMDYKMASRLGGPGYVAGENERVYHAYYQWVPFYLFAMALLFVLPHAIWKAVDNRKLQHLLQGLNVPEMPVDKSTKSGQILMLSSYFVNSIGEHWGWSMSYLACELLNTVCLCASMYLTDLFLGKEFSLYGVEVVEFLEQDPENRQDPMSRVFPRVTKCNFNTYGPSGSVQRFDALCILSSNILNEKIFTFLWFWFLMASCVTLISLVYRILTVLFLRIRVNTLQAPLSPQSKSSENECIERVVERIGYSDWILLRLLRLNIDDITFDKLISSIYQQLL